MLLERRAVGGRRNQQNRTRNDGEVLTQSCNFCVRKQKKEGGVWQQEAKMWSKSQSRYTYSYAEQENHNKKRNGYINCMLYMLFKFWFTKA